MLKSKRVKKKTIVKIFICICSYYSMVFAQDSLFTEKGIYLQAIGKYNNLSCSFEVAGRLDNNLKYVANIDAALGWGASIGYRLHGKGIVDGSIEISYVSSSHRVEYRYLSFNSVIPDPNISGNSSPGQNNKIDLNSISVDITLYFFNQSRFQPLFTFGFESYLKTITLKTPPLDNYQYIFNTTYSGFGIHGGVGIAVYLKDDILLDASIRSSLRRFEITGFPTKEGDKFNSLNIEYGSSISIFL